MKSKLFFTNLISVSILILSTVLISVSPLVSNVVYAIDYTGDQYVTNSAITNSNNQEIGNGGELTVTDKYEVHYEWEIPDNTFKQGDVLYFSITEEFKIVELFNFPLNVDGQEVGQARIKVKYNNGYYIEMTFTKDYV